MGVLIICEFHRCRTIRWVYKPPAVATNRSVPGETVLIAPQFASHVFLGCDEHIFS